MLSKSMLTVHHVTRQDQPLGLQKVHHSLEMSCHAQGFKTSYFVPAAAQRNEGAGQTPAGEHWAVNLEIPLQVTYQLDTSKHASLLGTR